jgi:hypothetical protein
MRIKDGLILEGKVQEMNDEEIFLMRGHRKNAFAVFSWRTIRWLPINTGSHFCPADLEHFCEFEVSFFSADNVTKHSRMPFCSNGMKYQHWYAHQANVNEAPGLP